MLEKKNSFWVSSALQVHSEHSICNLSSSHLYTLPTIFLGKVQSLLTFLTHNLVYLKTLTHSELCLTELLNDLSQQDNTLNSSQN